MRFELFKQLYSEALEYEELDMYIAERGWQEWMNNDDDPAATLTAIFELANSTLKESRERTGLSRDGLANLIELPYRTLQDWELGNRKPPAYVKMLIDYVLYMR